MPRGVYERKPKNPDAAAAPKRRGRPPSAAKVVSSNGRYAAALEQMRRDRDALDAAIKALESF